MTSSLLIAAALSIASTNDYLFTRSLIPSNTVLVGYGVGTSGSNRLVRAEDVCFLREALAERYVAVKGPTYTNVPNMKIPLYVHGDIVADVADFAPESFDRVEWFHARGMVPSFVDPSFSLIGGTFRCSTNWTVHITGITYPDQDVRTSYLPFLSASTRRMTFDQSITNISVRAPVWVGPITNAYAFVQKLGSVTVEPQDYCGTALYPRSTNLIDAEKTDTIWYHQYNHVEKTYQTPHGPVTYEVPTSIASSTSITTDNTELYEQMPWPLWKIQRIAELTVGVPWSAVCPRWFESGTGVADVTAYGSARDAYHDWYITRRLPQSGDIHVYGRYPSNLPKGLEATAGWLVCGWRWSVTDTKTISNPFSPESTETEILENACCVVVFRFAPRPTSAATGRGLDRFVWDTRLNPTSILDDAVRVLGVDFKLDEEPDELVPRDIPQTAVVPSVVQSGTATGTHRIDRKLECEWVNVVLVFSHTFNATFDDD